MFAVSWCFLIMIRRPLVLTPTPPLCPYTPLFRSAGPAFGVDFGGFRDLARSAGDDDAVVRQPRKRLDIDRRLGDGLGLAAICGDAPKLCHTAIARSEEHTSELQALMRNSYAVFCFQKTNTTECTQSHHQDKN